MEDTQGMQSASGPQIKNLMAENERILLVDTDPGKRKLRLASMMRLGMSVCCASDAAQARVMVRESAYAMVLVNLVRDRQGALKLRADMQEDRPEQTVYFFVGKPPYLAYSPLPEHEPANSAPEDPKTKMHDLITRTCNGHHGRGRLQEAAWRIKLLRRQQRPFPAETVLPRAAVAVAAASADSFADAVRRAQEETPNEA